MIQTLLNKQIKKYSINNMKMFLQKLENHERKLDEIDEKNNRSFEQGQKILTNQARIIAELSKYKRSSFFL